jgi:hypothetical protein
VGLRVVGIQLRAQIIARMTVVGYQCSSDRPSSRQVVSTCDEARILGTSSCSDFLRENGLRGYLRTSILRRYDLSHGHRITSSSIDRTHVLFQVATTVPVFCREQPLQRPSPATMTLSRKLGPTSLPFNSSVYYFELKIDDEKAQCRHQTSKLYHISDPYHFLYPTLGLLVVSIP